MWCSCSSTSGAQECKWLPAAFLVLELELVTVPALAEVIALLDIRLLGSQKQNPNIAETRRVGHEKPFWASMLSEIRPEMCVL